MSSSDRSAGRRFDRERNVTTQAILFLSDLDPEMVGDAGAHATHYEPVPVADLHAMLDALPSDFVERATFVDVGAGMGRALLIAAEYPFVQVAGVEISPALYEVAKENVERAPRDGWKCRDVRVARGDARMWSFPPRDLVAFLYNPFDAQALRMTLGAIEHRRDAADTWLLYHTPVERAVIDALPQWETVAELAGGVAYRHR